MSNFIRGENELAFVYTSGGAGGQVYNIGAVGTSLRRIIFDHDGANSGIGFTIFDTRSGTATSGTTSGLYLVGSGATIIQTVTPPFLSGQTPRIVQVDYELVGVNSGLAIMISGGAGNSLRMLIGYVPSQS